MSAILRKTWIDISVLIAIIGALFAGMRGFSWYFPVAFGRSCFYSILMLVRFLSRKKPTG